jgi:hypothetical protein
LHQKLKELFGIDLRALALFRIGIAIILLWDGFSRFGDLQSLYSDQGAFPRILYIAQVPPESFSLYFMNGSPVFAGFLLVLQCLAAVALLAGWHTRKAAFLAWILFVSLVIRSYILRNGGDVVLCLSLFWGLFLPLGARYSMDRLLQRPQGEGPQRVFSFGTAGILIQFFSIFLFAALSNFIPRTG